MTVENQPYSGTWEYLKKEFFATGNAGAVLDGRTTLVDARVLQAYEELLAPAAPNGLALLAVGGYGRRQLFPYSDVDLLLLFESPRMAYSAKESIAVFLRRLWDAGLRVSHSVRTPAECSELHDRNIELNISLLDQRLVTGDPLVYGKLAGRLPRFIHGNRDNLIRNLSKLTRERHEKYSQTFYHLEPNIKETPGGLRDFQLIWWLGQIKSAGSDPHAAPKKFPELQQARDFFFALRCYLHYETGRDNNAFNFEAQEFVAGRKQIDPAECMRDYFRHARDIYRIAIRLLETSEAQGSSLFAQFRDRRSRLSNTEFTVARDRVYFREPQQLDADPKLLLRLLIFIARHGIRLAVETEQRIASHLSLIVEYFSHSRPIWEALNEAFSLPYVHLGLRALHETGVLRAFFPELEQIECLVIRDFYHRYTVDEHTLVAIQTLAQLRDTQDLSNKRYGELFAALEQPGLLVFALLFHDAGKGDPEEGHVNASLRIVELAMHRIQVPVPDREMVRFLIRSHLDMSGAMNGRDLHDPATAAFMAHQVETLERLKCLTLATYADISAVNPTAMTPWRSDQLWQLYLLTYNELTRELDTERIESADLISSNGHSPERASFLEGFPTRYLRTHSTKEIDEHARMEEESRARGVAVAVERLNGVHRVTLVAPDKPFLFASLAGTLSSFGMNILKAEAFANRHGTVLDTFTFADPSRTLELNPSEIERLRVTIERVVLGKVDVKQLLKNRPKPSPPGKRARLKAAVSFDAEISATATLIQIVAEDRPGLLYDFAATMSSEGCNIEVVLIDTEGRKAIDVFYVTAEGQKLNAEKQLELKEALLRIINT